jgi:hypothetical protein
MKFIYPSLPEPGSSFIINGFVKDSSYGIGSKGYVSFITYTHETYQNIAKIVAMMIRRGKGGKPRLEKMELCVPIFVYFENEENFRKIMPNVSDMRNYSSIEIEETHNEPTDLLSVPTIEFIGWSSAVITALNHAASKAKYGTWPEDQAHPLNRFRRLPEVYSDDYARFDEVYENKNNRAFVIEQIRQVDASLFKIKMGYRLKMLDIIMNAAEFLVYVNKGEFIPPEQEDKTNEFRFTENQTLLDENLKYHKEAHKDLYRICSEKKIPMI